MSFHVLLVESDGALSDQIRDAFGPAGYSVTALSAGEAAVERCQQEPPDLIVLAAELPDMSGFSVCNRLKRALASVPLILYTADATESAVEAHKATHTRADEYLRKPFDVADLLGRAAGLLQGRTPSVRPEAPPPSAADVPPPAATPEDAPPEGSPAVPGLDLDSLGPASPMFEGLGAGPEDDGDLTSALDGLEVAELQEEDLTPLEEAPATPEPPEAAARPHPGRGGPPPMPPPMPGQRAPAATARISEGRDPFELLGELPRDPAPPKGTPEEKLEYFRDRLRARDTFIARVREAGGAMKSAWAQVSGERDALQAALDAERARAAELEQRLQEAGEEAAEQVDRLEALKKQLEASENTRQSLSDVLSETMQQQESAEQDAAARLSAADADRARLEAELAERAESHAKAVAALEADRAEERARAEAERAELEGAHARALEDANVARERERAEAIEKLGAADDAHARALEEAAAERERERAEAAERLAATEQQLEAEREARSADVARLEAGLREGEESAEAARRAAEAELDTLRVSLEEAEARAQATEGKLAEAYDKAGALSEELGRGDAARAVLEEELNQARADAAANDEKAVAAEHAWQAKAAELEAAEQRIADLVATVDEGRASAEVARGDLQRLEALHADAESRAAQATAERDQLSHELDQAQRATASAQDETQAERERVAHLEAEVQRLSRLEAVAEEAVRLRKEVATLRELVQQRTAAAETASRAAQAAAAERARAEERLAVEGGKLVAQAGRLETELATARRRLEELERAAAAREAALRKAASDAEQQRRAQASEVGEVERKHSAEAARLRAAMVDLEKHLETRARSELQLKKRLQELERAGPAARPPPVADAGELAKLKARLAKLTEDIEELRSENDFLNGEVARYQQKNKELTAKLGPRR